jgi:hypothetical protein
LFVSAESNFPGVLQEAPHMIRTASEHFNYVRCMKQASQTKDLPLLIPAPLRPGDTVGVVAASGPIAPELLETGTEYLLSKGFRVTLGDHILERNDYLAGTDDHRCFDLNSMIRDPDVRAILFARGGYGIMRILDSIDHEAISADPKILLGMSDLTALQLSLYSSCNLITFAGPMIAGQIAEGLDPISEEWLFKALGEQAEGRNLWPTRRRPLVCGYCDQDELAGYCWEDVFPWSLPFWGLVMPRISRGRFL